MANIADLIANRNQELEDFKQKKQEERTEAYERRDAAVMEVTSDPEKYRAFLDLHAQTMYNAANTATVWKQRPGATQLLPRKKWAELGRKIREDETPVQVFMRDTRSGYIKLDYVYDKAQTVGDPVPVRGILRDGTPDMEKALGALLQSSPVAVSYTHLYTTAFAENQLGYGSAKAIIMAIIIIGVTLIQVAITSKKEVQV